jgi:hypothetical protein
MRFERTERGRSCRLTIFRAGCHSRRLSIVDPGKDVEPMKYALLIYAAEKDWAERSKEEQGRIYNELWAYSVELKKSGKMVSCEPLDPTSTATTVRVRDGKTVPTDGSRRAAPWSDARLSTWRAPRCCVGSAGDRKRAQVSSARFPQP